MPKVSIDGEVCKGCGICIDACPKGIIHPAEKINSKGYHPATVTEAEKCIACAACATMCPDVAITVED